MADGNKGPENLSDVLARLFVSRGWGRQTERVRLERAWVEAVGPAAAEDSRVSNLRRGILEVEVRSGVLLQELAQFRKRTVLIALRTALVGTTVSDVKFRTAAW